MAKLGDLLNQAHKSAAGACGRLSIMITGYGGKVPDSSADIRLLAQDFTDAAAHLTRVAEAIDKVNAR